jgi:hypothetical protein
MKPIKIRYVVLAKSIPEYSKRDGFCYTCSLGYSPELGLIRVYPLPVIAMHKWDIYEILIERNKYDTRAESWKLSSYARKENWIGLDKDVRLLGKANPSKIISLIANQKSNSIKTLNVNKNSIGLIHLNDYRIYWDVNNRYIDDKQYGLFEDVEIADFTKYTKETKTMEARIYFRDSDGEHDLQYNEWQIYEYQRKFAANDEAFRFMRNKNLLLIGNMHNYRNSWIGLGVFEYNSTTLF